MERKNNPNLDILMLAVDQLGDLSDEMVFVGGCATGLLITDQAAPPIRVTRDVDAIVQVVSHSEYYILSKKLRIKGFIEDTSDDAPLCRWVSKDVVLDVMPTDPEILGFGNDWYSPAIKHSKVIQLPTHKNIRLVSAPYFIMTKLEAFEGRGQGDYLMSHDVEDVIAVLDGRPEVVLEVEQSEMDLRKAIAIKFNQMKKDDRFIDAVSGHMLGDIVSQSRVSIIVKRIKALTEIL